MGQRKAVRAPTNNPLPSSLRVPSTAQSLVKSLIRLSKRSLIDLALHWLQEENQTTCAPYLASNRNLEEERDEDYLWSPAETVEELRLTYHQMRPDKDTKKRSIIDRILDGDWRRGLSLYQIATIDFYRLSENDKALRWTALKLVPQSNDEISEQGPLKKKRKVDPAPYPTISPNTFLRNLQHEISPVVKAHYLLHQLKKPQSVSVIRIYVADSPYANPQSSQQSSLLFTEPNRTIFIALPDSCPYIYVSVSGTRREACSMNKKTPSARTDVTSLKRTVLEEIPKALSKTQHRYALEPTSLTARSLAMVMALRGNSGTNAANGVYTIFAKGVVDNSPIDIEKSTFSEKILQACEVGVGKEQTFSASGPALDSQLTKKSRETLAERSTNVQMGRNSKSEKDMLGLKIAAVTRFGVSDEPHQRPDFADSESLAQTGGLDRLQVRLDEDIFLPSVLNPSSNAQNASHHQIHPFDQTSPSDSEAGNGDRRGSARMTLTFQGSNIFVGIRKLVESGVVGLEKLPTWMTGEDAISGGTVRHGTVVRGKGAGA
jgi:central kinetochore subunit Mis15/CHL4